MKLDSVSEADLVAEIDRRKKPAPTLPDRIRYPEWGPLMKMIQEGLEESIKEGYEDEDFKQYVYEGAMKAVYGEGYFQWRNAQKWG